MKTNYYQKLNDKFNLIYNVDIFLNKKTNKLALRRGSREYDTFKEMYESLTENDFGAHLDYDQ